MNYDLVLMFASLILLAISGLLLFCFTESKGKNTPHARKHNRIVTSDKTKAATNESIPLDKELV